jgi:hypothetical protein
MIFNGKNAHLALQAEVIHNKNCMPVWRLFHMNRHPLWILKQTDENIRWSCSLHREETTGVESSSYPSLAGPG